MRILLSTFMIGLFSYAPFAHAEDAYADAAGFTGWLLGLNLMSIAIWCFVLLLAIVAVAVVVKPQEEKVKNAFFWSICAISLGVTVLFILQTTVKNVKSETKGPVHWHADFRIFNCEEELDLLDPEGLLNRIGTPTVHEHNDKRIHIEGTMMLKSKASLGNFFKVIGGELTKDTLVIPTNEGTTAMRNGNKCGGKDASLQVFVWSVNTENNRVSQQKLSDPASYVMAPHSAIPPGDCVIIEYGEEKDTTTNLCKQYEVAKEKGKILLDDSLLTQ